jgi:type I restriction enzyme, S subunit
MSWPSVRLSALVDRIGGGTPSRKIPEYWGSGLPWFTVADLADDARVQSLSTSRESITDLGLNNSAAQRVPKSAVVISTRVVVGKVGVAEADLATNQDFSSLKPKNPGVLMPRFLAYYLVSIRDFIRRHERGLTIPGITTRTLDDLLTPLPPFSEQHRVVELLDQADRLRRLRTEADVKAERILPALFLKLFGDPPLNPMQWETAPLGEVGVLDRGRSRHRPRNDPALLGGPYPLIQTGDVAKCDGRIRDYTQTYSQLGLAQSKMWPAGTLCITIAANIARTGVLGFGACFPDSVVGFAPGPRVTTEYIQYLLDQLQPALERKASQMAQKNINLEVLREVSAPIPPRPLQDAFSRYVSQHYDARTRQIEARASLEQLVVSLNFHAFSGSLTASWREAHMNELVQEMEHQAKALREDR